MFTHETKEAIKTGLALSLTLLTVHWLGWQKTSWATLTVIVLSLTEVYGYSALKSQNRVLGTILGATVAFVILFFLGQERFQFFAALLGFLAYCVYMTYDTRRGYLYNIAMTVCVIVLSAGIGNSSTGLVTAILRFQETILGLVVFSLVFRLVWPTTTDSEFYRVSNSLLDQFDQEIVQLQGEGCLKEPKQNAQRVKSIKLIADLVSLPETKKTQIAEFGPALNSFVNGLKLVNNRLVKLSQKRERDNDIQQLQEVIGHLRKVLLNKDTESLAYLASLPVEKETMDKSSDLRNRIKGVAFTASLSITLLAMWILMPVPGGNLFPVFGLIIAVNIPTMPAKLANPAIVAYILFAMLTLLQYVFIFPALTESWQLALFFFANVVIGHHLLAKFHLTPLKVLFGNALVNMAGSATELTPSYDVLSPITILVYFFIVLAIVRFYAMLFEGFLKNKQIASA